jgi:hypothetical protein
LHVHLVEQQPGKIYNRKREEEEDHCHKSEFDQGLSPAPPIPLGQYRRPRRVRAFRRLAYPAITHR